MTQTIGKQGKPGMDLDLTIAFWLAAKSEISHSLNTVLNYREHLGSFRKVLQQSDLDLDSNPAAVAPLVQVWADFSAKGRTIQSATYNKRLAIISSYYTFAHEKGYLREGNPINLLDRRAVQEFSGINLITPNESKVKMTQIDRSTLCGRRDFALLCVGIQTGRRLSELAGLRWGDLQQGLDGQLIVTWRRIKGGKTASDILTPGISQTILDWLAAYYLPAPLETLNEEAPVWISLSPRNRGEALSIQTIADICEKRLGTSKVHTLRHTFTRALEESGARVRTIQNRLGHTSLTATGRYLAALHKAENEHAAHIAQAFGLES